MMVAFLIGAAIGFLAGFEEAKTERRYEDADEEPEIYRPIPMEHTHGGGLKIDTLQKGNQSRTAAPNGPVSPLGHPFDKISRKIAHSSLRSSHTIFREISLYVSLSSAQVRRRGRILIS